MKTQLVKGFIFGGIEMSSDLTAEQRASENLLAIARNRMDR